jgi:hypothetical protein
MKRFSRATYFDTTMGSFRSNPTLSFLCYRTTTQNYASDYIARNFIDLLPPFQNAVRFSFVLSQFL